MDKLEFRTLEESDSIELYLTKVENYSGVRLPQSYARASIIVGVFLHDKLVAGYMLVTNGSFRSLMFVPDSLKRTEHFFATDSFEMMEVNGLWIGPALKTPLMQFRVWRRLILDIFRCRKRYVLLMHNSKNQNMKRFLQMANPTPLYGGSPQLMAGADTHQTIDVCFTTRWKILMNSHKYFIEFLQRQKRASKVRGIQHATPTS